MLTDILPGAAIAISGVATIGYLVTPKAADAMPVGVVETSSAKNDELVQKAQVVVVAPRRRRRGAGDVASVAGDNGQR